LLLNNNIVERLDKKNTYVRSSFINLSLAFNTLKSDIIINILKSVDASSMNLGHLANGNLAIICKRGGGNFTNIPIFLLCLCEVFTIIIVVSINTKHSVCNFIFVIHCTNVMSHILKFANTDVTYSPQLLY